MLLGRSPNGELATATPGAIATCPGCGAPLRAYCGPINIWHWQHTSKECDPWHESEGEWHLGWKALAPRECTEVVMGPHRADIRTRSGVIIELQASSISADEIREREAFYGNMVWLLDGRPWYRGYRFLYQRGRMATCTECERFVRDGRVYTRGGCKVCGGSRQRRDPRLGDEYHWSHHKKAFGVSGRPIYVDTGDAIIHIHGAAKKTGGCTIMTYQNFCGGHGLAVPSPVVEVPVPLVPFTKAGR